MKRTLKAELWRDLCASLGDDDGTVPRQTKRGDRRSNDDRITRRLCGQVARVLQLSLAAELSDPELQSLRVRRVEPAPDASTLRVIVTPPPGASADERTLTDRLTRVAGVLRASVADGITRRRAPRLLFVVDPTPELGDE